MLTHFPITFIYNSNSLLPKDWLCLLKSWFLRMPLDNKITILTMILNNNWMQERKITTCHCRVYIVRNLFAILKILFLSFRNGSYHPSPTAHLKDLPMGTNLLPSTYSSAPPIIGQCLMSQSWLLTTTCLIDANLGTLIVGSRWRKSSS